MTRAIRQQNAERRIRLRTTVRPSFWQRIAAAVKFSTRRVA